jgi:hypothetical protein
MPALRWTIPDAGGLQVARSAFESADCILDTFAALLIA